MCPFLLRISGSARYKNTAIPPDPPVYFEHLDIMTSDRSADPEVYRGVASRNQPHLLSPTGMQHTRRSALSQSRTLYVDMEVHKASIAVAYVAKDPDAAGIALGTFGTRPGAIAPRVRKLQAKAKPLVFVYAAGPCGYWL
jgi:hypothetical protein